MHPPLALLNHRLSEVMEHLRRARGRRGMTLALIAAAVTAVFLGLRGEGEEAGVASGFWAMLPVLVLALGAVVAVVWVRRLRLGRGELARRVEAAVPELDARLKTVVEREEGRDAGDYFHHRLVAETLREVREADWAEAVMPRQRGQVGLLVAALLFVVAQAWMMHGRWPGWWQGEEAETLAEVATPGMTVDFQVEPGDVEIEKGSRLAVSARLSTVPAGEVMLVWTDEAGQIQGQTPMQAGVEAGAFGCVIFKVMKSGHYRVHAGAARSEASELTVFERPRLEQMNVEIHPPEWTGLPMTRRERTLKARAPAGSRVIVEARVNKPLAEAELFAPELAPVPLRPDPQDATLLRGEWTAEASRKYRVHLVDDAARANANPPWFELTVDENRTPKIEVVFPKRDLQVSPIQELPLEVTVRDDVSVLRSGLVLTWADQMREIPLPHDPTSPRQVMKLAAKVALEQEKVEPLQLISYHFWAEDKADEGSVRRVLSDLFFAEVRSFEDIFRETEPPPSEPGEPKAKSPPLMKLQKEVVQATWNLQREVSQAQSLAARAADIEVVRESQSMALEKTKEAMEEVEDAEVKSNLTEAWKAMRDAIDALEKAGTEASRAALAQAGEQEQAALQWLHRASEREHQVTRQNRSSSAGTPGEREEQVMELELTQEEQRYEEEKAASAPSADQQQDLQILSRLKELARRQEALRQRLQELQQQQEAASSDSERQSLQDQIDEVEKEQQDLLADIDSLQQRMDQQAAEASEPSAEAAQAARQELDRARQQAEATAEQLQREDVQAATTSAARAADQLKELEESYRERTAGEFSRRMQALRQQSQAVKEAQQTVHEALENQTTPKTSGDTSAQLERMMQGGEAARDLAAQRQRVQDLLESLQQTSEEAEAGEPLLSRQLYEAVREARTAGLEEQLERAQGAARYGQRLSAQDAERKALKAIEELDQRVASAANSVLGSEEAALRLAGQQLDELIDQARQELSSAASSEEQNPKSAQQTSTPPTQA
ncbi:MAG: hypothetical protein KDK99_14960, partial [Verrucomicrobiales bacterium]|nr:hypothetical protein [Verrucomicrobiales bacterium]